MSNDLDANLIANLTTSEIVIWLVLGLVIILIIGEALFRCVGNKETVRGEGKFLRFHPFVMATGPNKEETRLWRDEFNSCAIELSVKTNHLGFISDTEYSIEGVYPKANNEKTIVWTGGSAAWGVGATAKDKITARRIEKYLNERQSKFKYHVENMAMGSWVAFQEFNALALWGDYFKPDWVLCMDGYNDASVTCAHSQGAGKTMYYELISSYIRAYLEGQKKPTFYRGKSENYLLKHSKLYQKISGKQYIPCPWIVDRADPHWGQFAKGENKWGELKEAVEFYKNTHEKMTRLFPDAGFVFGLQPIPDNHKRVFSGLYSNGLADDEDAIKQAEIILEELYDKHNEEQAGMDNWEKGKQYFFTRVAIEKNAWVNNLDTKSRPVIFGELSRLFPVSFVNAKRSFMDSCHLTDLGQDLTAKYYTDMILYHDCGLTPPPLTEVVKQEIYPILNHMTSKRIEEFSFDDWAECGQKIREMETGVSLESCVELMRRVMFLESKLTHTCDSLNGDDFSAKLIQKVMA